MDARVSKRRAEDKARLQKQLSKNIEKIECNQKTKTIIE